MGATAPRNTRRREGLYARYPIAGGVKIYQGTLVCLNASGYAVPADDAVGYKFVGVATETIDNTSGSDGDTHIKVVRKGTFAFSKVSPSLTDIGNPFYVKDDSTVRDAADATNDVLVGVCVDIDASTGEVWVEIG